MTLLPTKEAVKLKRLQHKTTPQEIADAEDTVATWSESIARKDETIRGRAGEPTAVHGEIDQNAIFERVDAKAPPAKKKNLPPVRGTTAVGDAGAVRTHTVGVQSQSAGNIEEKEQAKRLSGYDFEAWEKFDVEAASKAMDQEKDFWSDIKAPQSVEQLQMAAAAKRAAAHQKEMRLLQAELGADGLTALQRSARATREKHKGNECFRIGDTQEAFDCYSRSLALDPANPVGFANRAMAAIRLERFELAEDDCTRALTLDRSYLKAWSRRGMTRFKRGNYSGAAEDFEEALRLENDIVSGVSAELQKMLDNARQKYLEVEGRSLPVRDLRDASSVALVLVLDKTHLRLPPKHAVEVAAGRCTIVQATENNNTSGFTRIQIAEDDEEEPAAHVVANSQPGFVRIAISEESDSDGEADTAITSVPSSVAVSVDATLRAAELKDVGNRHMKAGAHREAIEAYTQSLQLQPSMLAALNNRAMAYLSLKDYAAVVRDTSSVLAQEPNNEKALYRRAASLHHLGERAPALVDIERVLRLDPRNAQAVQLKQDILAMPVTPTATAPVGRATATELDMTNAKRLALAALEEGDAAGAARLLEAALRSDYFRALGNSNSLDVKVGLLHLLHTAHLRNGDAGDASVALDRILAISPNNFKALLRRAEVLKQLGRKAEARKDVESALAVEPADSVALALLASLTEESANQAAMLKSAGNDAMADKRYAEAADLYTQALFLDPSSTVSLNNRAQAFVKLERYANAVEDATAVLDRCRGHFEHLALYKKALFRRAFSSRELANTGGTAESLLAARSDFEELLRLEPDNKAFQQELQRTESLLQPAPKPAPLSPLGMTERSTTKVAKKAPEHSVADGDNLPPTPPIEAAAKPSKAAPVPSVPTPIVTKRPAVPTEPPKTVYEIEKVWRALKGYPDLFAAYLALFKKSTFKRVFKETISSELVSSMFSALKTHGDAAVTVDTLTGLTAANNFDMMLSLLPSSDVQVLREIFARTDVAAHDQVASLRAQYKL